LTRLDCVTVYLLPSLALALCLLQRTNFCKSLQFFVQPKCLKGCVHL